MAAKKFTPIPAETAFNIRLMDEPETIEFHLPSANLKEPETKLTGPQIALLLYIKGERSSLYKIKECEKARDIYNPSYKTPHRIQEAFAELVRFTPAKFKNNPPHHNAIDHRISGLKAIQSHLSKKEIKLAENWIDALELTRRELLDEKFSED